MTARDNSQIPPASKNFSENMLLQPVEFQRFIAPHHGARPAYINDILKKPSIQAGFYFALPIRLQIPPGALESVPLRIIEDERSTFLTSTRNFVAKEVEFTSSIQDVNAEIAEDGEFDRPRWYWPVILGGYRIYGHWLVDIIPRVLLSQRLSGRRIVCLLKADAPAYARKLLGLFDIESQALSDFEGSHIVALSTTRRHDWLCAQASSLLREKVAEIKTRIPGNSHRASNLYLSRKLLRSNARTMTNRADVETFFHDAGFTIVHPETMSLEDQIAMFSTARIVAGEAGSALHNSIWCSEDCRFLGLQSARQSHFIQNALCHQFGQRSVVVFGKTETDGWGSPFAIDMELLAGYREKLADPTSDFWSPPSEERAG